MGGLCESSANPEKTHLLTEENLVVFQFPYPSSSPIFEIINTPVSCNGGNPSVTSIACFGKNVSITCDGNEDSTLTFVCKREMQPICNTTIFSNANITKPRDNICFLQSFNAHSIQCACDLCKLREFGFTISGSRRKLSNPDCEFFQAATLTSYVVSDFIEVNKQGRVWEGSTYADTISVFLTFGFVWMTIAVTIFLLERYIASRKDKNQRVSSIITPKLPTDPLTQPPSQPPSQPPTEVYTDPSTSTSKHDMNTEKAKRLQLA